MTVKTRDFGTIECDEQDLFTFEQPPFGFEQYEKYVLIQDDEVAPEIAWLQSVAEPSICFVLLEISAVPNLKYKVTYDLPKSFKDCENVEYGICILAEEFKYSTINLKSPIIINLTNKTGVQIMVDQDYTVRHLIMGSEVAE